MALTAIALSPVSAHYTRGKPEYIINNDDGIKYDGKVNAKDMFNR